MSKKKTNNIPSHASMMNPLLKAIHILGGSGTIDEINLKTIELLNLPEEITDTPHSNGSRTEVEYRLAWTRTYLKKYGLLENSIRGVWSLVNTKRDIVEIDPSIVVQFVRNLEDKKRERGPSDGLLEGIDLPSEVQDWRTRLINTLMKMDPSAFERLIQRLLRESGFYQVEVTGKTGDGGIDGKGIFRIAGLISFNVLFQCKRWSRSVSASDIRDFRGALQGRADKGLFVTVGSFTREALKEASREGATPIDLLDGDSLSEKLKELSLGIKVEVVEQVNVDEAWYESI